MCICVFTYVYSTRTSLLIYKRQSWWNPLSQYWSKLLWACRDNHGKAFIRAYTFTLNTYSTSFHNSVKGNHTEFFFVRTHSYKNAPVKLSVILIIRVRLGGAERYYLMRSNMSQCFHFSWLAQFKCLLNFILVICDFYL